MFLAHIKTDVRADVPQVPTLPIPLVVSKQRHPRIDRGCCLDVRWGTGSQWLPFSYHSDVADAVRGFEDLPAYCVWGDMSDRWRIVAHELDLDAFEPLATRQPEYS